jgi:homoserine O-succinyltransferase
MPLFIEGQVPNVWSAKRNSSAADNGTSACIKLALINNMPDPALEDTELQFFELLDAASNDIPVFLKLYSLTGIPRTDRGRRHLENFYCGVNDLLNTRVDGLIVTGTEPRQPNLKDETYWGSLTDVLQWAEHNTTSTILSCLAAHASVLFSDGIDRHRLVEKQFGVFDSSKMAKHALTDDIADRIRFPHSRWNEVRAHELKSCGYRVLTQSPEAGVDIFVKEKKKSLFVHLQGHPEYGCRTLLKEYRRDIKRFLVGERDTYPKMPAGYFNSEAAGILDHFRDIALSNRCEETLALFPDPAVVLGLHNSWLSSATRLYRNWLKRMEPRNTEVLSQVAMSRTKPVRLSLTNSERT